MERRRLVCEPVLFTPEQRESIERELPAVCERGGWELHAVAAAPNHVHVLLTARADGKAVRQWLKRWLGEALDGRWRRPASDTWWSKSGSVRWVWTRDYLDAVYAYVREQATPRG